MSWLFVGYVVAAFVLLIWAEKAELHAPTTNLAKIVIAIGLFVLALIEAYNIHF